MKTALMTSLKAEPMTLGGSATQQIIDAPSPPVGEWTHVAVVLSGIVGSAVDSVLFLSLAGIPLAAALPGLLLAKVWVQLLAAPMAAWLRRRLPQPA